MFAISAKNLVKKYSSVKKREGIIGGLIDLLTPEYQEFTAVDNISLDVKEGEFLGYIGPNGAGKSTSIKMLTGILQPTSGEIRVLGFNPFQQRKEYCKQIGVVFGQRTQLWWDIAVVESFELLRRIYEIPKAKHKERLSYLVDVFKVSEHLKTPVRKLSLGERMKCDIIASLIHDPKILFLDEPTIGLDALAKNSIREILRNLHKETKTTIVLTTHDLIEIEELCKRIVVLDKGKIVYDGNLEDIRKNVNLERALKLEFSNSISLTDLAEDDFCKEFNATKINDNVIELKFNSNRYTAIDILSKIKDKVNPRDITIEEPSIEEVISQIYVQGGVFKS